MSVKSIVLSQILPEILDVNDKDDVMEVLEYNPNAIQDLLEDEDSLKDSLDMYIYDIDPADDEESVEKLVDIYESHSLEGFVKYLYKFTGIEPE